MTAPIVNGIDQLVEILDTRFPASRTGIIGIDGGLGVGKSTRVASKLHEVIEGTALCVDDFVTPNQGRIVAALQRERFSEALRSADRPTIVDGVCLLEVLKTVGVKLDFLIYVKRISRTGIWSEDELNEVSEGADVETVIQRVSGDVEGVARWLYNNASALSEERKEVLRYHSKNLPVQAADLIFHNVEDDLDG